ncbi:hypothetical protein D3C84_823990 [compost metagenome]
MQAADQACQSRQVLLPVETFLVGNLAQGFSGQRPIQHSRHAGGLQSKELQDLKGGHTQLLQFDGIVDEAFRIRTEQGGRKNTLASKQFEDIPILQQVDFRAEAIGLQYSGAFNHSI